MKSLLVIVGLLLGGCGKEDPVLKAAREAAEEAVREDGEEVWGY